MDTDSEFPLAQELLRAGELLAGRGAYGIVWLDESLVVRRRFGSIVAFVKEGAPVTESVAPLVGLEADIKALEGDGVLRVPNIKIITTMEAGPRLNISVYRFAAENGFLMVVAEAGTGTGLEIELSRQVRARLMAEAEVLAKSRELAGTNAELRMANNDLEQFAAIVTHDFKAPMRALRYLVDDIEVAVGADDRTTAGRKLGDLRRQAERMSSMLEALLGYVSAGLSQPAIEHVDTGVLVSEIVRSLPRGDIEVEIRGDWPALETLAVPLDLALRNLIDNAITHHDREQGRIVVACEDVGEALRIVVEDDGPGIASEHHASIFLPFRTLGSSAGGMGLAIVKKMVGAVGGTVALGSQVPGRRGAIFEVRWPKRFAP